MSLLYIGDAASLATKIQGELAEPAARATASLASCTLTPGGGGETRGPEVLFLPPELHPPAPRDVTTLLASAARLRER
ncbi:hypothetical protein MRX96_024963 [Rhipicephalus microplus]